MDDDDVVLNYELDEYTTEQGTPFDLNMNCFDYGPMAWLDSESDPVDIPQGCKLFYPADYVLFDDSLVKYTNGDVSKLALKTDIPTVIKTITGYDATKTQVLKNVLGTLTWVDEE